MVPGIQAVKHFCAKCEEVRELRELVEIAVNGKRRTLCGGCASMVIGAIIDTLSKRDRRPRRVQVV